MSFSRYLTHFILVYAFKLTLPDTIDVNCNVQLDGIYESEIFG